MFKVRVPWGSKKGQDGSEATVVKSKIGKDVILLTPHQKASKAAEELRANQKYTNSGIPKNSGPLTAVERAHRSAYVSAMSDMQDLHNAKNNPSQLKRTKQSRVERRAAKKQQKSTGMHVLTYNHSGATTHSLDD